MILRKASLLALALLLCLVPAALATETAPSKFTLFVDAGWVKANASSVVLVDARASTLYAKGHIPGAANAEWTYFANVKGQPGNPGWGEIFPKDTLAKKIGALGINGKKPIVVYGDCGGWGQEGWVAWILRLSGIENVRVLDGGYNAWLAAGGKASTTATKPRAVAFSIASFQGGYKVTTPWLASKLGEVKVVDARTPFEYEGGRIFQERRGGHIPGAINIPYDVVFKPDMTVREVEELDAIFKSYGLDPEDEIVVYDTAGVRAAHLVMVLRMAGYDKARNYDSSFHEWAGTPELEVVQGKEPGGQAPAIEEIAEEEPPQPEAAEGQSS
ncbi:MAG: sulfurtransferase [Thermovirgaceae bacterium]|nr:sulfurtransferase [Synergistales bacterium]MDI9392414.1 sulfurtransferase [Synergistota bacterium]HRW87199.1 sulfurtransferase [Thermovirgaceae bacterium]MDD3133891.1 sulfurtransferase [Synergistales bacterium]MDD3830678.1 sulfurtransferase [Synergistales bacterium]